MSMVQTEHVLVIPTSLFDEIGAFQGFCAEIERYRRSLFDPQHTRYRRRDQVETDPNFKQLIPYVIFRWKSPDGPLVFQYTRGQGQGETRLHRLRSIGVGGHISVDDAASDQPYRIGMQRELDEEVVIDTEYKDACVGLINDDSNDVGRVHLGIVHVLDVESPNVSPREVDLVNAGFQPLQELVAAIDQFESWSQICLRWLDAG